MVSARPKVGYKRLQALSEMEADEVVFGVMKEKSHFNQLLKDQQLKPDWIKLLVKIFTLISESEMRANVIDLYSMLIGSPFIGSALMKIIQELPVQKASPLSVETFIDDVLTVFEKIGQYFTRSLRSLPIGEFVLILPELDLERQEEFKSRIDELLKMRTACVQESARQSGKNAPVEERYDPPPEDFRELSIQPDYDDLMPTKDPYLRPIKECGQYSDGEEYLDIQFRLMKEDFIAPLREGLNEIVLGTKQHLRKVYMKVYRNVHIIAPQCSRGGITHKIQFDASNLQHVQWKHSKRLIFGSLLCFSSDNFETFFFATVANRDPLLLKHGEVDVHFLGGFNTIIAIDDVAFDMVESPAFYEAYQHVLKALQQIQGDEIPFSKYIVSAQSDPELPKYLRGQESVEYDLEGCLTDEDTPCTSSLHEIQNWESKSVLNTSQLIAVQKALTRDFVVIQGPPGTGKTYVGLKIAHTLLQNIDIWQKAPASHILVVCYTNHALDQFVEGLAAKGHEDIIRCGGRCRNETVLQYTLQEKVKSEKMSKVRPSRELRNILQAITENLREKEDMESQLESSTAQLKRIQEFALAGKIMPYGSLAAYLPEHLLEWFERYNDASSKGNIPFLEIYLGLYPVNLDMVGGVRMVVEQNDTESEIVQNKTADMAQVDGQDNYLEFVDVEGEAEELIDRWVINEGEFAVERGLLGQLADGDEHEGENKFSLVDSEGFHFVLPSKRERRDRARRFLNYAEPMTEEGINNVIDPEALDIEQRWMLYKYLMTQYMINKREMLIQQGNAYDEKCAQIKELDQRKDEYHIQKSKVIAMTTTGAARYRQVLTRINPQIIIIEEAAEVLEAHVITSLTEGAEHVILIGDHKQLKPKPTVYDLAKNYNLELSLFERMIRNGMDCHCLDIQHRMRPEIASLLQDIYPNLQNHTSVTKYPDVLGVGTNLHFIDHSYHEDANAELKSKSNEHEAKFIVALCNYLLLQGYCPEKITILTLYTGQLLVLKNMMPKSQFQGVRVSCVDNFQGEECDIVLLSLVRSNEDGIIGFAEEENRICVSLSRAKVGLFVIGDFTLLAAKSYMWNNVVKSVQNSGNISDHLPLFCRNHPEKTIDAKEADDFKDAPSGGCKEPCMYRLKCGHTCQKACHPFDQEHQRVTCMKKCEKSKCDYDHKCRSRCHFGTDCSPCMVKVKKLVPQCGHEQSVPCSIDPESFDCVEVVERTLACGHVCKIFCHIESFDNIKCKEPCQAILDCEHKCNGNCTDCYQGRIHIPCQEKCNRVLVCSHVCKENCSKECPPCKQRCKIRCSHNKCKRYCGEICPPCREPCSWSCKHKRCSRLCHEICDREPCNEPCGRKIKKCGHPCVGLCGEKCPKLCRICNKAELEEILFGTEDEEDARFLQLMDCNHVIEVSGLDHWMKEETSSVVLKCCPKCNVPILNSQRYGNIIKKEIQDIEEIKGKLIEERRDPSQHKAVEDIDDELQQISFKKFPKITYSCFKDIQVWTSKKVEKLINTGMYQLETISENQVQVLQRVATLVKNVNMTLNASKLPQEVLGDITEFMPIAASCVTKMCLQNIISRQQLIDIDVEVNRLSVFNSTLSTLYGPLASKIPKRRVPILKNYLEMLRSGKIISKAGLDEMRLFLEEIRNKCGMQPLTKDEKEMVIKAMGLRSGHWYKCPNGHFYAIGECGGAMETSKCPECNATIGGADHALAQGNAHAGEFDGSRHAAWSEGANLLNFDPDDL